MRRVTDALDAERIAVREALGYRRPAFSARQPLRQARARNGCTAAARTTSLTDSGDWREHIVLTAASLHAGGRAHRPVVPDLGRRARRRGDAARARLCSPSAARSAARISCDGADACAAWASAISTGRELQTVAARGIPGDARAASPVSAPDAWAAASPSCSPMPDIPSSIVDFKPRDAAGVRQACGRGHGRSTQHADEPRALRAVRRGQRSMPLPRA